MIERLLHGLGGDEARYDIKGPPPPTRKSFSPSTRLKRLARNAAELMTLSTQLQTADVQLERRTGCAGRSPRPVYPRPRGRSLPAPVHMITEARACLAFLPDLPRTGHHQTSPRPSPNGAPGLPNRPVAGQGCGCSGDRVALEYAGLLKSDSRSCFGPRVRTPTVIIGVAYTPGSYGGREVRNCTWDCRRCMPSA